MVRIQCDRCEKLIENNTYYTVRLDAHDINPTFDGRVSSDTFAHIFKNAIEDIHSKRRNLCSECIHEIESCILKIDSAKLGF